MQKTKQNTTLLLGGEYSVAHEKEKGRVASPAWTPRAGELSRNAREMADWHVLSYLGFQIFPSRDRCCSLKT